MNKAHHLAGGDIVVFMNAGDEFFDDTALSRVQEAWTPETDILYGSNIYRFQGHSQQKAALPPPELYKRLHQGRMDMETLQGYPCHQTTYYRRAFLEQNPFPLRYRFAADHALLFKALETARVHQTTHTLAIYHGGGLSYQNHISCLMEEWWIAARIRHSLRLHYFFLDTILWIKEQQGSSIFSYARFLLTKAKTFFRVRLK